MFFVISDGTELLGYVCNWELG